jgi:hypothetical protein
MAPKHYIVLRFLLSTVYVVDLDKISVRASWRITTHLEDLDYADTICFLSHRKDFMHTKFTDLALCARKAVLEMNLQKTKEVRVVPKMS